MNQEQNEQAETEFTEWGAPQAPAAAGTSKLVQWVIKYSGGLVKDEKQAQYVVLGLIVLTIILSLFLLFGSGEKQEIFTPTAEAPTKDVIPAEF
jgi:hypothetical protein